MSVVVLGLDAFHTGLLDYTPFIREIFDEGSSSELESTTPPVTAPAWASFQTGVNQGKHGVFDFVDYSSKQGLTMLNGRALRAKPVYEYLDEKGFDCYIQNLPFSLPPRIDGDIMPSWLDSDDRISYPPNLCSKYQVDCPRYPKMKGNNIDKVDNMRSTFKNNSSIFLNILRRGEHNFYFYLVSVTDWVQHFTYEDLIHSPDSEVSDRVRTLLAEVDEFVKEVFENSSDEDDIIVLSDHGFKLYEGKFYLNDWLKREGYLSTSGKTNRVPTKEESNRTIIEGGVLARWVRRQRFWPYLRPIKDLVENHTGVQFTAEQQMNTDESIAYCQSKDEKAIRFNEDVENPHQQAEKMLSDLNKIEGIKAISSDDIYNGPYEDNAGQIILEDKSRLVSRGPCGEVTVDNQTAHHSKDGIFIGKGPSFKGDPDNPSIFDITPTILYLFGLEIPNYIDGCIMRDAVGIESEVKFTDVGDYSPTFFDNSEEMEGVEERLQGLGYL